MGVGADRTGDLAHGNRVAGVAQPLMVAGQFKRPCGELQPERCWLRPDAVGAADHHGVAVLDGSPLHDMKQVGDPPEQQISGIAQDDPLSGVENVARRQPVVDPLAAVGDRPGQQVDEGCHVVIGDLFAFFPGSGIHRGCSPHSGGRHQGSDAEFGPRLNHEGLDLFPHGELVLFAPDRCHLRQRVAGNHPFRPSR